MSNREVMQQALEAGLESDNPYIRQLAANAVRKARVQPVQEPLAWLYPEGLEALQNGKCWTAYPTEHEDCKIPLYTTPQQQQAEPVAWDKPSASFDEWWDGDRRRDNANPFTTDSFAYWAWEGWQAAQRPWVELTEQDMPSGEDPMFDHRYFIAGMVYADKVLKEKNNAAPAAQPEQRKPLDEWVIDRLANNIRTADPVTWWRQLARDVENAHNIKEKP